MKVTNGLFASLLLSACDCVYLKKHNGSEKRSLRPVVFTVIK